MPFLNQFNDLDRHLVSINTRLELIKEFINCKQPTRCVNKFMPCNKIFHDYPLCQISASHNGQYFFQWNVYDDVSQNCGISGTYDNVYLIFSS